MPGRLLSSISVRRINVRLSELSIAIAMKSDKEAAKLCSSVVHSRLSGNASQLSCSIETTPARLPPMRIGTFIKAHSLVLMANSDR
jgi:hypothetical protein